MIEVLFKAQTIADLKLQIQEYSLCHLGLNFKAMADQLMTPQPTKPAVNEPGKSEEVKLKDGTIRLHNPNYPSAQKNLTTDEPKKRGRPVGWRKEKSEPASSEKDKVRKAIHDLNDAKGFRPLPSSGQSI